ncbi:MAG TPA: hypothetical protein PLQ50_00165 [Candidatus Woesebacteria bacterium]|nr:hypothetical protein [Candidatus Woesebacteria bacterium]
MELTFKTENKKTAVRFLRFLPKDLRSIGLSAIILNIISLLITLIFYTKLQKEIPLFYSLPSDQQLADKKFIFILPAIATAINLAHFFIAYAKKEINPSVLRMFIQITFLLQVLVLAILLRIIIIVY